METYDQIREAASFLQKAISEPSPEIAVILGSGLGAFAEGLDNRTVVEMSDICHWPVPTVEGHRGRVISGKAGSVPILALQGRVHFYEGYSVQEVVFPVRVLKEIGVKSLIITNAAGSLNPNFAIGDIMIITDHINFMFTNPLIGPPVSSSGPRFPDMSEPYDSEYITIAESAGRDLNIPLKKGILIACTGPSYETAAEVKMMQSFGADAVCMSTVPEVIAGVQMGLRILGISCITNMGTGLSKKKLAHREVEKVSRSMEETFVKLIKEIISRIYPELTDKQRSVREPHSI